MELTRIRKKLYNLWKDNCSYLGRLRISGAVMLALSFMFLFFGPLEIVAFSGGSLVFTYRDVLPVLVVMLLAGLAMKITKANWISDYALPVSLILGMASAIPITAWLG